MKKESSEKMQKQCAESLLGAALTEWGVLFGKRFKEEAIEIWLRVFKDYRVEALAPAVEAVTKNAERNPTPGLLTKEVAKIIENKPWLSLHWEPPVTFSEGKDQNGKPCVYWSDDPQTPAYCANDCTEGKMFLALMADIAKSKTIPQPSSETELAQKWWKQQEALLERADGNLARRG